MNDDSVVFESDITNTYIQNNKKSFLNNISDLFIRVKLAKNEKQANVIVLVISIILLLLSLIMVIKLIKPSIYQPTPEIINSKQPLGPLN